MKTKKVAASLPLVVGIILGAITLTFPFLRADHYIWTGEARYSVDNYLFFFWGKLYTVAGSKIIMSRTVLYDFGDFPVYVMVAIIISLIFAATSIFAGRGLILSVKGRELKLKLDVDPLWFQVPAIGLLIASYIYMDQAVPVLTRLLQRDNYIVQNGPAIDFLLGSIAALTIATIMTAARFLKDRKNAKVAAVVE